MKHALLDGKNQPSEKGQGLRVGELSMLFENGGLRYVRYGGLEVLRGIYSALRDRNWGTVPPVFSNQRLEQGEDALSLEFDATYQAGDIDFRAEYRLEAHPEGFTFRFSGKAHSSFYRNRLGLCVLHPMSTAGASAKIEHVGGAYEEAKLPVPAASAQPVLPFSELKALEHEAAPGLWARLEFAGDIFETEDQRNWTDASFKTFCTPLRLPFPVLVEAGTVIEQSVTLQMRGAVPQTHSGEDKTLRLGSRRFELPALGTEVAGHGQLLSGRELERLRALDFAHLRISLDLSEPLVEKLVRAVEQARSLGLGLEVALTVAEPPEAGLAVLRELLQAHKAEIARFLVYPHRAREMNHAPYLEAARRELGGFGAPLLGGTNGDFFFLNTYPVPPEAVDGLAFALNPQVHAFDNASLVETLEAQAFVVQEAGRLSGGKPVVVSPVSFKPRWNPYATAAPAPTPPGELPSQVDPRQLSLFGAVWTLGCIKALSKGQAESVTLFETTGWRGLMETEAGSPVPERFPSEPGGVFPLYHVLADLAEFKGGEAIETFPSHPLEFGGLMLRKGGKSCLLLANYSPEKQTVGLDGFPEIAWLRKLRDHTALASVTEPDRWRQSRTKPHAGPVELPPYAYVRLEFEGSPLPRGEGLGERA